MEFYEALQEIMAYDPGGRGVAAPKEDLASLADCLLRSSRVLILTGFPVLLQERVAGETDGPCGTAELAATLEKLGVEVLAATDGPSYPLLAAALQAAGCRCTALRIPENAPGTFACSLLETAEPDCVIALERPGKAGDGHFHSMRGKVLDGAAADTDCFFALAREKGIPTVGIGDGGNELGMGALRREVARRLQNGACIAAERPADYTLVAGVSNWWGAGLAALLQHETGVSLLFSERQETAVLRAVVGAGGVDGCTGRAEYTVDGLPPAVHLGRRRALNRLLQAEPAREARKMEV